MKFRIILLACGLLLLQVFGLESAQQTDISNTAPRADHSDVISSDHPLILAFSSSSFEKTLEDFATSFPTLHALLNRDLDRSAFLKVAMRKASESQHLTSDFFIPERTFVRFLNRFNDAMIKDIAAKNNVPRAWFWTKPQPDRHIRSAIGMMRRDLMKQARPMLEKFLLVASGRHVPENEMEEMRFDSEFCEAWLYAMDVLDVIEEVLLPSAVLEMMSRRRLGIEQRFGARGKILEQIFQTHEPCIVNDFKPPTDNGLGPLSLLLNLRKVIFPPPASPKYTIYVTDRGEMRLCPARNSLTLAGVVGPRGAFESRIGCQLDVYPWEAVAETFWWGEGGGLDGLSRKEMGALVRTQFCG